MLAYRWVLLRMVALAAGAAGQDYQTLADEVHRHFDANVLHVWFPRCVDEKHGGFIANFSRQWAADPKQDRFLVFQARMTWLTAQVLVLFASADANSFRLHFTVLS